MSPGELSARLIVELQTACLIEKAACAAHDSFYHVTAKNSHASYMFVKDEVERQEWREAVRAAFLALKGDDIAP